jgi:tRNA (guanine-N7-)-methyltransferase
VLSLSSQPSSSMKRLRHHVNPLRFGLALPQAARVELRPGARPVEVEPGCADAEFLLARAAQFPSGRFIGIEIREQLVRAVNRRARVAGLANLEVVFANLNVDLPNLFRPASVDRIFFNFPDPWFKRRHQKRRVLTPELAAQMAEVLVPAGELFFQSDVFEVALEAMAELEAEPLLGNAGGEWSFTRDNPYGVRSRREWRCEERGHRIWRLLYLKRQTG